MVSTRVGFMIAAMVFLMMSSALAGGELAGTAGVRASDPERSNPLAGRPDAVLAGRKLYLKSCSHCHGAEAEGKGKAMNLRLPEIQEAPPGLLFQWIKNGNLRAGMPAWSHFPDVRIWQIVSYLQTLPPAR